MPQSTISREEKLAGDRRRSQAYRIRQRAKMAALEAIAAAHTDSMQVDGDALILRNQSVLPPRASSEEERRVANHRQQEENRADNNSVQPDVDPPTPQSRLLTPRRALTDEERRAVNRRQQQECRARKRAKRLAELQGTETNHENPINIVDRPSVVPAQPRRATSEEERRAVNRRQQQECRARKRARRAAELQATANGDENLIRPRVDPSLLPDRPRRATLDEGTRAVNRRRQQECRARKRARRTTESGGLAINGENLVEPEIDPSLLSEPSRRPISDEERRAINRRRQQECRARKRAKRAAEMNGVAVNDENRIHVEVHPPIRNVPTTTRPRTLENRSNATAAPRGMNTSVGNLVGIGDRPAETGAPETMGGDVGDSHDSSRGMILNGDDGGTFQQVDASQQQQHRNPRNQDTTDNAIAVLEDGDGEVESAAAAAAEEEEEEEAASARALQSEHEPVATLVGRLEQAWGSSKQQLVILTQQMQLQEQHWKSSKQQLGILIQQIQLQGEELRKVVANTTTPTTSTSTKTITTATATTGQ